MKGLLHFSFKNLKVTNHIQCGTVLIQFQASWVHRLCGPHPPLVVAAARLPDSYCPAWRCQSCNALYITLSLPANTPRSILSHCRPHPSYHGWVCWAVQSLRPPYVFFISCIYPLSGTDTCLLSDWVQHSENYVAVQMFVCPCNISI